MNRLKTTKIVSVTLFILTLCVFAFHLIASLVHTPLKEILLLNERGGVYQNGDLSQKYISSGETRQFFFDFLSEKLNFDYRTLATDAQYEIRLDGGGLKEVPDYRDLIRPYFTEKGFNEYMAALKESPMLRNFWSDGKYMRTVVPVPPQSSDLSYNEGKVNAATKRLEYSYVGSFYTSVYGRTDRQVRYKVSYAAKLIRVPAMPEKTEYTHYFAPLVNENFSGMKIDSFSWKVGG
jgi:hypothetical protein